MKPLDENSKKRMKKLMETVFAPFAPKSTASDEILMKMNKAMEKMLNDLDAIEPFDSTQTVGHFAHQWKIADQMEHASEPIDMSDKCQYQVYGPDWESAGFE